MSDIAAAPKLAAEQEKRETAEGLWRLAKALRAEADAAGDVPHMDAFVKNSHWVIATMRAIPLLNVARAQHTSRDFKRACLRQMQENTKGMLTSLSLLWVAIGKELKRLDEAEAHPAEHKP